MVATGPGLWPGSLDFELFIELFLAWPLQAVVYCNLAAIYNGMAATTRSGSRAVLRLAALSRQFHSDKLAHRCGWIDHGARFATDAMVEGSTTPGPSGRMLLYRGDWILPFRLLVRGKVFQLAGAAAAAVGVASITASVSIER